MEAASILLVERFQISEQLVGGRIPGLGARRQARVDDALDGRWNVRQDGLEGGGPFRAAQEDWRGLLRAVAGTASGEQLVEDETESVNVRPLVGRRAPGCSGDM